MDENKKVHLDKLLLAAIEGGASDVHLKTTYKPVYRKSGQLKDYKTIVLDADSINEKIQGILTEEENTDYSLGDDIDKALVIADSGGAEHRYRVHAWRDNNGPCLSVRVIPDKIIDIRDIGFPNEVWKDIINLQAGLVLVTGYTGSGKSTTLASIIQEINNNYRRHIITLERPIEYRYEKKQCLISQREVGKDVKSYQEGVKGALRSDPDIILVGEIRHKETARHTIEAAETGHLVFSTLHTQSTYDAISRLVNMFEANEQMVIRDTLSTCLAYILSQKLIPHRNHPDRALAMEILNVRDSYPIRNRILKGEYYRIPGDMQSGQSATYMITMDQHLEKLCRAGKISIDAALDYARQPKQLKEKLQDMEA